MKTDSETSIEEIKEKIKGFCEERDWCQFHNAKELAIAISTEASELLEHFRFKSYEECDELFDNPKKREEIEDEVADVIAFIARFAQKYSIDISKAFERKMQKNATKYTVEKSKGSHKKYNELD